MKMSDSVINVDDSAAVFSQTSSKGNQKKWCTGDKWIKADELGYEGLSEVICSRLAAALEFPYGVVEYHPCVILDEKRGKTMTGCYSHSFIGNRDEITLGRLMKNVLGEDPAVFFDSGKSSEEKINFVVSGISKMKGLENAGQYLSDLLRFDWLVLNEDRHYHNIIFLSDRERFYFSPLFDCGAALLSDVYGDYPLTNPLSICIRNVKAKPFSKSFSRQCEVFEKMYGNSFKAKNISVTVSNLKEYYSEEYINRACDVLKYQYSLMYPDNEISFI